MVRDDSELRLNIAVNEAIESVMEVVQEFSCTGGASQMPEFWCKFLIGLSQEAGDTLKIVDHGMRTEISFGPSEN